MSILKNLELQRLVKELQFVESDYEYQSEILRQTDRYFFESVDILLENFPDLKKVWNEKNSQTVGFVPENVVVDNVQVRSKVDNKVKKIYREIVKSTHPDKIKNSKLNELYLEATFAYESNDIVTLIKVSSELLIDLNFDDKELESIKERINQIREQIQFLESTYTFKWLKSSDVDKNKVILSFIQNRLRLC
jgi:hypothetical protein